MENTWLALDASVRSSKPPRTGFDWRWTTAVFLIVGCAGSATHYTVVPTQLVACDLPAELPTDAVQLNSQQYQAYGDSITAGFLLTQIQDAYPSLISNDLDLLAANNAVPGAQSCDLAPVEIFPNEASSTLARHALSSIMIGTNDAARDVPGYEPIFAACLEAVVSFLAIPAERKVLAVDPSVQTIGVGRIDTSQHWNSWVTASQGASIQFPLTLVTSTPVYIWIRIIDGDKGTYKYSVDGKDVGTGTTGTNPPVQTSLASNNSLTFLRIANLAAGQHTLALTKTNGEGTMQVVGVGIPPVTPDAGFPNVLVSDIPYALDTGQTGCSGTATASLRYIADIQSAVILLHGDGLNIRYVATREHMFGTAAELVDQVHPNALGHQEIRTAFEAALSN